MRFFSEKYRLLTVLGLVLTAGFVAVSTVSFIEAKKSLDKHLSEQTLPITGDAIYAQLQKEIVRPILVSSTMAQDVFVRDWILNGESSPEQITRYLKEIVQKHGASSGFLASDRTGQYYTSDGTIRIVQQSDASDAWFFQARELKLPYQAQVAIDSANQDLSRITVRHRMLDDNGNYLGVAGVSMGLETIVQLIDSYHTRFDRSVYLVNAEGNIVVAGKSSAVAPTLLQERPGIRTVAPQILNSNSKPVQLEYQLNDATILVNSRLIPELGWYLVVEKNATRQLEPIREALILALAIGILTIAMSLAIVLFTSNRDRKRMERMASFDPLTGLLNRQAFEIVLEQSMLDIKRSGQPISAILFDLDSFQQVNDQHGHAVGDRILRGIAQLARGVVRDNDIITRWSGTEFLILLRNCPLEIAVGISEKLRNAISSHNFELPSPPQTITASFGVAQYGLHESQISFFIRTDKALRDAKAAGRNRTIASVMENQGENIAASLARRG